MREIDISISTVPRAPSYLDTTVRTLGAAAPVYLVAGSGETDYLAKYCSKPGYTLIDAPESEWEAFRNRHVWHRASWNYWRCLSCFHVGSSGLMLLEDDVELALNWRRRLESTLAKVESAFGVDYVLALYSPYQCNRYQKGLLYQKYAARTFFGDARYVLPRPRAEKLS